MNRPRIRRPITLALALVAVLPACSSSDDATPSGPPNAQATLTSSGAPASAISASASDATIAMAPSNAAPLTVVSTTTTIDAPAAGVPVPPAGYVQPPATATDCRPADPDDFRCYSVVVPVDPAHPDTPGAEPAAVSIDAIAPIVRELDCWFVTADLARRNDGTWRLIEIGDGQVSDRPPSTPAIELVGALATVLR